MSQKNVNDIVLMVKYNFTFVLLKSGQNTVPPSDRPVTCLWICRVFLKSIHFKKPVTRSSFLSKSVVTFVVVILKMTTLFERNEDRVTGFLK